MFTELWSDESALLTDPNDVHILLHTVNISGYLTTVADDYKNFFKKIYPQARLCYYGHWTMQAG